MNPAFKIGQNSLEVAQVIVRHHPEIKKILLVAHEVRINWRQKNKTLSDIKKHLLESFIHHNHTKELSYSRKKFLALSISDLPKLKPNQVWSITSKVICKNNKTKHIPMMNFHPNHVSKKVVIRCLMNICKNKKGVLLDSGRFYHYYGNFLIDERGWLKFMADFLMPTVLVSPRYVGHRLYFGYCTLRLTSDTKYKPTIPKVIEKIH